MKGRAVKYKLDDGSFQKAHVLTNDQDMRLTSKGKVIIRLVDDTHHYMKDENGKCISTIKKSF